MLMKGFEAARFERCTAKIRTSQMQSIQPMNPPTIPHAIFSTVTFFDCPGRDFTNTVGGVGSALGA